MKSNALSRARAGRGFSFVETAICVLVVGLLLVASMRVATGANLAQAQAAERAMGQYLAAGLINEITTLAYADPGAAPLFGREAAEAAGAKAAFNDVDDFNGWTESPPQDHDGATMPGLVGWSRSVTVERVAIPDVTHVSSSETGAKRITVTVTRNNRLIATCVAIRTDHR
jgi:hypothetical protein